MLVRELYENSILYEDSTLAHTLYHLLVEKKITLDDNTTKINFKQVDHKKVAELVQRNVLGIHYIRIYSLKMNQKMYIFIFAASEEVAIQFYIKTYHSKPLNCHEYPLDTELSRGNGVISFRDMRREFESFPAEAGYYEKKDWAVSPFR